MSVSESESIFDLATLVVTNSKSSVSVPLCARLALLVSLDCSASVFILILILEQQKVFVECSDLTYWNKVDAQLLLICTMADGDAWKVTKYVCHHCFINYMVLILCNRAFECILQKNWDTYSDKTLYTLNKDNNEFQTSVNNTMTAESH